MAMWLGPEFCEGRSRRGKLNQIQSRTSERGHDKINSINSSTFSHESAGRSAFGSIVKSLGRCANVQKWLKVSDQELKSRESRQLGQKNGGLQAHTKSAPENGFTVKDISSGAARTFELNACKIEGHR
jgi:hypothetical protein